MDLVASEPGGDVLAEIHGKLSRESTLAAERLEDTLTDAVFGALRYLPRKVLGAVFNATFETRLPGAA